MQHLHFMKFIVMFSALSRRLGRRTALLVVGFTTVQISYGFIAFIAYLKKKANTFFSSSYLW